ncbi:MAG: hypothetical protein HY663_06775 [Chloroflexi bacterium]|nr:hypothetical protein [Chloroflexota bacterium]
MKKLLLTLIFVLVFAHPIFAWNEPKGIMGLVFGKEPKDLPICQSFEERWKKLEREGVSLDEELRKGKTAGQVLEERDKKGSPDQCWERFAQTGELGGFRKIGDIEVTVAAFLLDDKVEKIELDFSSEHFDDLRQILAKRYGPPSKTYRIFPLGQTVLWVGKNLSITMVENGPSKGRGEISYQTNVWQQRERKQREKVIQKGVEALK